VILFDQCYRCRTKEPVNVPLAVRERETHQ
jgi:hypothetical protein